MTTLAALVAAAPAPTAGRPAGFVHGAGTWRHVLELADPAAGSAVAWRDLSAIEGAFVGYEVTRGSDGYQGRYRASVVNLDLYAGDDSLAPWNPDTSALFGTHVELGPGLLIRSGFIRVDAGVVVEWNPRFTNKVEFWGDSSYSRGKVRQHRITARDTMTSLVGVPLPSRPAENWSDRVLAFLTDSGWQYGSAIYGAQYTDPGGVPILTLPARAAASSAVNELDATADPAGLVWYTNRLGQLVMRPRINDTFHADAFAAGATGDAWPGDVTPVDFVWWACEEPEPGDTPLDLAEYAVDTPGIESFGFDKSERWVINHVKVTAPTGTFDDDDPVSIQRHDRKTLQATWTAENDVVAGSILELRANAVVEARPLTTTVAMDGFHPGPAVLDYLGYVAVQHRNNDEGLTAFGNGWVRDYRERVRPLGCDLDWSMVFTLDVYSVTAEASMLPVVDLTLVDVSDTEAEFAWANPTQTIVPTHTQVRLLNPSSLWGTVDYPITGMVWAGLAPSTSYEFQVRLIRKVDGLVTHFSPSRSLTFTTDPTTVPTVEPDPDNPGEGTVTFPTPGGGCVLGWELQQSATGADPWTTIDSGTDTTAPFSITYDLTGEDPDAWYRYRSREICSGIPGAWHYSTIFPPDCFPVARLGTPPWDDAVAYWPRVCPDQITEAISDQPVVLGPAYHGPGFDTVAGVPVLISGPEGLVAYDVLASAPAGTHDLSITCRVRLSAQPTAERILFEFGGMWISATAHGSGFRLHGNCREAGAGITTIGNATDWLLSTTYELALTHDVGSDNLRLYVNAVEQASALGTVGARSSFGQFAAHLPANSWGTDYAVWDRVLAAAELPGYVAPPPALTVTINQKAGQSDPATGTPVLFQAVFSEAVSGFVGTDVTITGTAGATTAAVSTLDNITFTVAVSGMTSGGTVIASIAAGVCTATATAVANSASTSTDNTITYAPITSLQAAIVALSPKRYYTLEGSPPFDDLGSLNLDTTSASGSYTPGGVAGGDGHNYLRLDNTANIRAPFHADGAYYPGITQNQTVAVLLKPDAVTGGNIWLVDQGDGTNKRGTIYLQSGRIVVWGANASQSVFYQSGTSDAIAGAWHLYIFRSQPGAFDQWYRDNVLKTMASLADTAYSSSMNAWRLGDVYAGGIAHIAHWNRALTTTEMTSIYNAAVADGWPI